MAIVGPEVSAIRIIHVIDSLAMGGAEMYAIRLARAQARIGLKVTVAYRGGDDLMHLSQDTDVDFYKLSSVKHSLKSLRTFPSAIRLAWYARREKPAVIHSHLYGSHVLAILAGRLSGVPVVEHVHDYRLEDYVRMSGECYVSTSHYRFVSFFCRRSDATIVLTEDNFQRAAEIRQGRPVRKLTNWVEPPAEAAHRTLAPRVPCNFALVSRLVRTKNIEVALRGLAAAREAVPGLHLTIVGDGPDRPRLERIASELNLIGCVTFTGEIRSAATVLQRSIALLHPSRMELCSLAILEAMILGAVVVASRDVSGNRELISDGVNGVLVPRDCIDSWSNAIVRLATQPDLPVRLAGCALRTVKTRHALGHTIDELLGVYATVTRNPALSHESAALIEGRHR